MAIFLLLASSTLYNGGGLDLTVISFLLATVRAPPVFISLSIICVFAGFPPEHIKLRKFVLTCSPRV